MTDKEELQMLIDSSPREACSKLDRKVGISLVYEYIPKDATWNDYPGLLSLLIKIKTLYRVFNEPIRDANRIIITSDMKEVD